MLRGYIAYNACRELPKMQVLHSSRGHQWFLGIIQNVCQCVLHHHKPYKILISSKFWHVQSQSARQLDNTNNVPQPHHILRKYCWTNQMGEQKHKAETWATNHSELVVCDIDSHSLLAHSRLVGVTWWLQQQDHPTLESASSICSLWFGHDGPMSIEHVSIVENNN